MKKWFDEDYEFELEVRGFLRGDKTEGVLPKWRGNRRQLQMHLWLPHEFTRARHLLENDDDIVSAYGGGAKWRGFAKFRRTEQIQQGYSLPRWLRDFQTHSQQNKQAKFL